MGVMQERRIIPKELIYIQYLPTSDPTRQLRTAINIICSRNKLSGINADDIHASMRSSKSISFKSNEKKAKSLVWSLLIAKARLLQN